MKALRDWFSRTFARRLPEVPPRREPPFALRALRAVAPGTATTTLSQYVAIFNELAERYELTTPKRVAAFLAQVAHESVGFVYTREIASGAAYEGRLDLGNTMAGDGRRFRGRGLIQVTGRDNYRRCSLALYGDERLLSSPALLEEPRAAAESAMWFWTIKRLNELADGDDFDAITRRINGGTNGSADRRARHAAVVVELGLAEASA